MNAGTDTHEGKKQMRGCNPADAPTEARSEWTDVLNELPACGRLMILGPVDVGKSTLAWWFARQLRHRRSTKRDEHDIDVGMVDADVGQSRIGPPACVGYRQIDGQKLQFLFVGAISPARRPTGTLKATVAACRLAAEAAVDWTVIDTTGYLSGKTGRALKQAKIRALRDVHVVAIGGDADLQAILRPYEDEPAVTLHRIPVPPQTRPKSRSRRVNWRQRQFAKWLSGTNLRWIDSGGRKFLNKPKRQVSGGSRYTGERMKGRLLGFSDQRRIGICLGLLHTYDFAQDRLLARCPKTAEDASIVDFGCLRLRPDGTQIDEDR